MIGFVEDLWASVFTPGTTPTLILATHISFFLLIVSLIVFVFLTNFNIHLCNLLVLSIVLWAAVTWFIAEIQKEEAKKSKEEEQKATTSDDNKSEKKEEKSIIPPPPTKAKSATATSTPVSLTKRAKRKV